MGAPASSTSTLFACSLLTLADGAAQLRLGDPQRYPVDRFERFVRILVPHLGRD